MKTIKATAILLGSLLVCATLSGHAQMTNDHETLKELAFDSEVVENEKDSYEEIERHANSETERLKSNIAELEREVKTLSSGAERGRRESDLAAKKFELKRHQMLEVQRRVSIAQASKKQADVKKDKNQKRLATVETKLAQYQTQNEELRRQNQELASDNYKLQRKLELTQARMVREQQRAHAQRLEKSRLSEMKNRLKTRGNEVDKGTVRSPRIG